MLKIINSLINFDFWYFMSDFKYIYSCDHLTLKINTEINKIDIYKNL